MGEFELLARLRARLDQPGGRLRLGSGDDAAVTVPGGATVTSVDALVDGVHFRREHAPLRSIGHKALAAGLSDLAAMGAEPGEAYIVLGMPLDLDEEEALELLEGARALAGRTGTALAGGDITRAPALTLAITVVGHAADAKDLVPRSGAAPGDLVAVTGELGGAGAGLPLLQRPALAAELPEAVAAALRRRQLEPWPRLAEGRGLAAAGASAMIDLSDGLGADAGHVAEESAARLELDLERLPVQAGVAELAVALGEDPLELAASAGEDYELLACVPEARIDAARQAVAAAGAELTVVGGVAEGRGVELIAPGGRRLAPRGFDQLA